MRVRRDRISCHWTWSSNASGCVCFSATKEFNVYVQKKKAPVDVHTSHDSSHSAEPGLTAIMCVSCTHFHVSSFTTCDCVHVGHENVVPLDLVVDRVQLGQFSWVSQNTECHDRSNQAPVPADPDPVGRSPFPQNKPEADPLPPKTEPTKCAVGFGLTILIWAAAAPMDIMIFCAH